MSIYDDSNSRYSKGNVTICTFSLASTAPISANQYSIARAVQHTIQSCSKYYLALSSIDTVPVGLIRMTHQPNLDMRACLFSHVDVQRYQSVGDTWADQLVDKYPMGDITVLLYSIPRLSFATMLLPCASWTRKR